MRRPRHKTSPRSTSLQTEAAGPGQPEAFGPFRVLHQIGAGALGPVFRVYDPVQDKLVAVKLFRLDLPPERVHKLVAEFQTLIDADLSHPAIATPIAAGIINVTAYLAMDFVAADSADVFAREHGRMAPSDVVRVAEQVARALDFALNVNVAHGALHPRDVLVSPDDARVTALGVAQALERVGCVVPVRRPYAAPERIAGEYWNYRADVFSLAAIVHELLWGRRITATGEQAAASLTAIDGWNLSSLRRVFKEALAESPAERFDSALEFVERLQGAIVPATIVASRKEIGLDSAGRDERRFSVVEEEPKLPLDAEESAPAKVLMPGVAVTASPAAVSVVARSVEPENPYLGPRDPVLAFNRFESDTDVTIADSKANVAEKTLFQRPGQPLDPARSALWPLALALVMGLSVGFAGGYAIAGRPQTEVASSQPVVAEPARAVAEADVRPVSETEVRLQPGAATQDSPAAPAPARETSAPVARSAVSEPPRVEGKLLIRSSPAGAAASVDGRDVGKTPVTMNEVPLGSHSVRVSRDGYVAEERRVALSAARPSQSLTFELARSRSPAAPARPDGRQQPASSDGASLDVDSRPAGATVFLNGKPVGKTPMTISVIGPGAHTVSFELPGYRSWTTSVRVASGEHGRVAASLEQ